MRENANRLNVTKMVELAVLTALVVVFQLLSNFMQFGPVAFSLALVPVVIGALMLGPLAGAYLGAVLLAFGFCNGSVHKFSSVINKRYTVRQSRT